MRLPSGQRSMDRVARLPAAIAVLNDEVTRLVDKKPFHTIRDKTVTQKPSLPARSQCYIHCNLGVFMSYILYVPGGNLIFAYILLDYDQAL